MTKLSYHDEVVWIIGASSGIGAALAREIALRGAVVVLSARNKQALEELRQMLGPQHRVFDLDVGHADEVVRTAQAIRAVFGKIDKVIFMAAIYAPMKITELDPALVRQMIEINLLGAFHVLHAVLPILGAQRMGQIALCGSVAGYTGLPSGQPYSATKAGIQNLAESLHTEVSDRIDIKLISPGFVETSMTEKNDFNMPMIITAEKAATYIADGLLKRDFEIHFPKRFTVLLKLLRLLPYRFVYKISRTFRR